MGILDQLNGQQFLALVLCGFPIGLIVGFVIIIIREY